MESFKLWIMSLCGATAISAIFKLLLSDSSLKKVINVFFSIFILFYTVMPIQSFFSNKFDFDMSENDISYDEYYENGYQSIVTQSIENFCNEKGIRVLEIEIDSYIDDEGYLNVNNIQLNTDCTNPNELESSIEKELGFEVTIQ